jgi:hypothetical protein
VVSTKIPNLLAHLLEWLYRNYRGKGKICGCLGGGTT